MLAKQAAFVWRSGIKGNESWKLVKILIHLTINLGTLKFTQEQKDENKAFSRAISLVQEINIIISFFS
ncbi:hypothetical protein BV372_12555 [Nostoc sp. T09]|nr:hypothetical protein BV372_12555 [Nostoc sp. T09]